MLYQQIRKNKLRTIGVVIFYMVLFTAIGAAAGEFAFQNYLSGMLFAVVGGGLYTWLMLSQATPMIMRRNSAVEIKQKTQYPELWNIVEDMALVAKVPMPKIYVIEDSSPNAFATGSSPEKAAVAVTTGLLERLNREELEGVIAHEVGHIRNYDVRLQTIAVALGTVISVLVQMSWRLNFFNGRRKYSDDEENESAKGILVILSLVLLLLGPLLSTLMQLALSRNREYLADASAVEFTRNPQGLISALRKISTSVKMKDVDPGSAMLYFMNPIKKEEKDSLFSTHPATANRIKRLEQM